ncbi:MAG: DUF123 domain-containing protein [Candidatus Hodarchaeota archaeon]
MSIKNSIVHNSNKTLASIIILGDIFQAGTYLLRIKVLQDLHLAFGRFRKGKLIFFPAGEYIYVGSALAIRGAMSLPLRLVRHATRSGNKKPHGLRAQMIRVFNAVGLRKGNLLPKSPKSLHWNIDYLLDQKTVELTHVIAICSSQKLEGEIARLLENDPNTIIIETGLGANDIPGNTHILRVEANEKWWLSLLEKLRYFLKEFSKEVITSWE